MFGERTPKNINRYFINYLERINHNMPTRAKSAYLYFASDVRPSLSHLSFTEQGKEMGRRWRSLSTGAKAPYQTQANTARSAYFEEKEIEGGGKKKKKKRKNKKKKQNSFGKEGAPMPSPEKVIELWHKHMYQDKTGTWRRRKKPKK